MSEAGGDGGVLGPARDSVVIFIAIALHEEMLAGLAYKVLASSHGPVSIDQSPIDHKNSDYLYLPIYTRKIGRIRQTDEPTPLSLELGTQPPTCSWLKNFHGIYIPLSIHISM